MSRAVSSATGASWRKKKKILHGVFLESSYVLLSVRVGYDLFGNVLLGLSRFDLTPCTVQSHWVFASSLEARDPSKDEQQARRASCGVGF